jgi:hypothetical protein
MFAESTLRFQQNAVNLILRQGNTDAGQPAPKIGFDRDPDTRKRGAAVMSLTESKETNRSGKP